MLKNYEVVLQLNVWRESETAEVVPGMRAYSPGYSILVSENQYAATPEGIADLLIEVQCTPMAWKIEVHVKFDGTHVASLKPIDSEDRGRGPKPVKWELVFAHTWLHAERGTTFLQVFVGGDYRSWVDIPKVFGDITAAVDLIMERAEESDAPAWWVVCPTIWGWKVEHNLVSRPFPSQVSGEAWLNVQVSSYPNVYRLHKVVKGQRLSAGKVLVQLDLEEPVDKVFTSLR